MEQLVVNATAILRIIYAQNDQNNMHGNAIFNATGIRDKPLVLESIRYLEKAKLIERTRFKPGKKRFNTLTKLGYSFVEIIDNVQKYNQSYTRLKEIIKQNFEISKDKNNGVITNMLRSKGYKGEMTKANNYKRLHKIAYHLLLQLAPQQNIDIIFTKYISILSQPEVINNKDASLILNKIIMDLLSSQVLFIQTDLLDLKKSSGYDIVDKDEEIFDYVASNKLAVLDTSVDKAKELEQLTKDIEIEEKEVLLSILNILKFKPSKSKDFQFCKSNVIREVIDTYQKSL